MTIIGLLIWLLMTALCCPLPMCYSPGASQLLLMKRCKRTGTEVSSQQTEDLRPASSHGKSLPRIQRLLPVQDPLLVDHRSCLESACAGHVVSETPTLSCKFTTLNVINTRAMSSFSLCRRLGWIPLMQGSMAVSNLQIFSL
ncbi:uncharacterized protein LOC119472963 [Cebus imitator]|uniref:uncharacterized protein LOC119472963 n=1 Tax=Cebus imitator TaxID=2715852 RepID=UPI0018997B61|nr:uncharacterized protein LOC119472963 [Cebus imitator]